MSGCNIGCKCVVCTPGAQGHQGDQGIQGATGVPGPTGSQGPTGSAGANGSDGTDGKGYNAFSSTNTNILDTAATTLSGTISLDKAYTSGARIRFSDTTSPSVNYFEGVVSAYDPLTGVISLINIGDVREGSGTINSWNVNLAGDLGDPGPTGTTGLQGPQGLQGIQGIQGIQGNDGVDGKGYNTLSNTSTDILDTTATSVTMTVAADLAYLPGARVRLSDQSNPSVNYFEGVVSSYNIVSGAMIITPVDRKAGSGTIALWNANVTGELYSLKAYEYHSQNSTAANQNPTGLDNANKIQIEFGPAFSNTYIDITALGLITILKTGKYMIRFSLRYGRTGALGVSHLFGRGLINGVPLTPSLSVLISSADMADPITLSLGPLDLVNTDTISVEIMRDSAGGADNSGGLYQQISAGGWANSETAEVTIIKL